MTEVREILDRTKRVYASCSSYSDEGECVRVCIQGPHRFERSTQVMPFAPASSAPIDSGTSSGKRGSVPRKSGPGTLSGGGRTMPFLVDGGAGQAPNLRLDCRSNRRANGHLGGTAFTVPSLLLRIDSLNRIVGCDGQVTGRELLDGSECWILDDAAESETRRPWIDVETGALRKVEHFHVVDPDAAAADTERRFAKLAPEEQAKLKELGVLEKPGPSARPTRWESTTVWRPRFDEDLQPEAFAFDPASAP